jgi:pantoate--beta-alanine ligase
VLNQALRAARQAVDQGERDSVRIRTLIQETISRAPLAKIDYIEIISNPELDKVKIIQPGTFAALAVLFGKTRLIDNIILMD